MPAPTIKITFLHFPLFMYSDTASIVGELRHISEVADIPFTLLPIFKIRDKVCTISLVY